MNLRKLSTIPLLTFPAAWVIIKFYLGPIAPALAIILVSLGILAGIVISILAARVGDRITRNRALWGIVINALYLGLLLYALFVLIPQTEQLAEKLKQQAAQRQQQQEQQQPPSTSPAPIPPADATPAPQ